MRECGGHLNRAEFDQIIREIYYEIPSPSSEIDSQSSQSGFVDTLMESTGSFTNKKVLSYDHNIIDNNYISNLRANNQASSIGNKEDVVLEPSVVRERVCITRSNGVPNEYFYFYLGVIEDFKICIPSTDFESDLLKTINVVPSQLRPNGWDFIKVFELVCETVDIIPTLGLFLSFFKLKGAEKGGWVSLIGIPGKSSLQAYTTNYKGFKDKFLQVKSGKRCPKLCMHQTGLSFPNLLVGQPAVGFWF